MTEPKIDFHGKKRGERGIEQENDILCRPCLYIEPRTLVCIISSGPEKCHAPALTFLVASFFPEKDRAEQKLSHFVNNYIYEGSETFIPEAFEHETEMDWLPFFIIFRDPRKPLFLICSSRKYSIYASIYRSAL